jgi:hypothetical protein
VSAQIIVHRMVYFKRTRISGKQLATDPPVRLTSLGWRAGLSASAEALRCRAGLKAKPTSPPSSARRPGARAGRHRRFIQHRKPGPLVRSEFNGFAGKDSELFWSTGVPRLRIWECGLRNSQVVFELRLCVFNPKSEISNPKCDDSSRLPQEGKDH